MINHTDINCKKLRVNLLYCDDCDENFCGVCDDEGRTDFEEGVRRCGICNAINNRLKKIDLKK